MASLTAKVVHGHKYFQIITSRRINGKPRQVVLAHLGTADTLFARLQQKQGEPIKARVQPFGFLAAAWGLAQKLRSEEHTSELQSQSNLVCRLLLEKKK